MARATPSADQAPGSASKIPSIAEVAPDLPRPLWSVMIPIHNCTRYLGEALTSVLEQAPGPEAMQIEVLDNVSSDRPEDLVEQLGRGRVGFHRHAENIGSIANCNACIHRSRGHLVHILHCDDRVAPGFYQEMARLAESAPDVALFACRSLFIDADGVLLHVTPRERALEAPGRDPRALLYKNPIQIGSAVIRREFYETFGGFNEGLVHTADWEMWIRAVTESGGLMSPHALAYFRVSEGGNTSRLKRTGENIRDHLRMLDAVLPRAPRLNAHRFRRNLARMAAQQAMVFRRLGDMESARANEAIWREIVSVGSIVWPTARAARATMGSLWRLLYR